MHCNILWTFSILFFSIHPSYVHMHMFCNSYCIFECVREYKKLSQLKILNVKNDKSQEKEEEEYEEECTKKQRNTELDST